MSARRTLTVSVIWDNWSMTDAQRAARVTAKVAYLREREQARLWLIERYTLIRDGVQALADDPAISGARERHPGRRHVLCRALLQPVQQRELRRGPAS